MAVVKMLAIDYAIKREISAQCVCRALRKSEKDGCINSKTLIGVTSFKRFGRMYELTVNPTRAFGDSAKAKKRKNKKSSK